MLVNDEMQLSWLDADALSVITDWIATADYAAQEQDEAEDRVPGILTLKCTKTRSQRHINVTCSKTRNGSHYQQKSAASDEIGVPEDSEVFAVICRARQLLAITY